MGALQTSLSNVQPNISSLRLRPSIVSRGPRRIGPRGLSQPNSDRAIASRSVSEDWVLVQRAIGGDSGSKDKLFAAHTAKLYRTAFAVLRNKEDAEDAVQDGLCSAYTKLRSFQGRSSFSTWLTRIIINSALMTRRRNYARPEASLDEILDNQAVRLAHRIVDSRPDPEEICRVTEIKGLVEKEVQKLPMGVRSAFQLREVDGLSTTESIRTLGICKNAFKSRVLRARRKLIEGLKRSLQAHVQIVSTVGTNSPKRRRDQRPKVDPAVSQAILFGPTIPIQLQKIHEKRAF
jgi:RNA polymerase sigma-70 factor (ECF subfamily)